MKLNTLKLLTWLSNATPEFSEASHYLVVHDLEDNAIAQEKNISQERNDHPTTK